MMIAVEPWITQIDSSGVRRDVDARTDHNHAGNVALSHQIRSANAREGLHSEPGARGCGEAMDAARRRGQADVMRAP
jgi:hypothetical protein